MAPTLAIVFARTSAQSFDPLLNVQNRLAKWVVTSVVL
ncbi:hypothetical protein RISK_005044 [Rhodopirellula islandica]|uniref:Uncharacterized protein n=1 Tax=Rhodopirellula islandica TaxID=595434 RepID=A0A0J1B848_RHOIS|nr:hypothetical protein RISK_005044 [Rhodopirellula islandica]